MCALGKEILCSVRNLLSCKLMYWATICPTECLREKYGEEEEVEEEEEVVEEEEEEVVVEEEEEEEEVVEEEEEEEEKNVQVIQIKVRRRVRLCIFF